MRSGDVARVEYCLTTSGQPSRLVRGCADNERRVDPRAVSAVKIPSGGNERQDVHREGSEGIGLPKNRKNATDTARGVTPPPDVPCQARAAYVPERCRHPAAVSAAKKSKVAPTRTDARRKTNVGRALAYLPINSGKWSRDSKKKWKTTSKSRCILGQTPKLRAKKIPPEGGRLRQFCGFYLNW